jgi:hypothetical protein
MDHALVFCYQSAVKVRSVRGWPLVSSHRSPGDSPQVGLRSSLLFLLDELLQGTNSNDRRI